MQNHRKLIKRFLHFLNYKVSLAGAFIMGVMVFWVNRDHGYFPASIAALKQITYTFFVGGFILKILEAQLKWHKNNSIGILWSVLLTTLLTTLLVYSVHSFKGTPEPFYSTLPTLFLAPFGLTAFSIRKKHLSKEEEEYLPAESSYDQ